MSDGTQDGTHDEPNRRAPGRPGAALATRLFAGLAIAFLLSACSPDAEPEPAAPAETLPPNETAGPTLTPATPEQLALLEAGDPEEAVALLQLYSIARGRMVGGFIGLSALNVERAGGQVVYWGNLDGGPDAARPLRFEIATLFEFPNRAALSDYLARENKVAEVAFREIRGWMVRPYADALRRAAGEASDSAQPALTADAEAPPGLDDSPTLHPALGQDIAVREQFMREAQDEPLMMLRWFDAASGSAGSDPLPGTPERAAANWSSAIPGGSPFWLGHDSQLLIGAPDDALPGDWQEVQLALYPSRLTLRAGLAALRQRAGSDAAKEQTRSLVLPGTPWPGYDAAR